MGSPPVPSRHYFERCAAGPRSPHVTTSRDVQPVPRSPGPPVPSRHYFERCAAGPRSPVPCAHTLNCFHCVNNYRIIALARLASVTLRPAARRDGRRGTLRDGYRAGPGDIPRLGVPVERKSRTQYALGRKWTGAHASGTVEPRRGTMNPKLVSREDRNNLKESRH